MFAETLFPLRKLAGILGRMCKAPDLFSGESKARKLREYIVEKRIKDQRESDSPAKGRVRLKCYEFFSRPMSRECYEQTTNSCFYNKKGEKNFYFMATLRFFLGAFLGSVISRTPSDRLAATSSTFISSGNSTIL